MAETETETETESYYKSQNNPSSSSSMSKLITLLSSILQRIADSNDRKFKFKPKKMCVFNALARPNISVQSYLERIFNYANCSTSCYVVAYIYLDRFVHCQRDLPISSYSVHRLLITSVMVAAKFLDDFYYNNAYYAKVGGISTKEMNFLEVDFLFGLKFQLNVTPTTFHTYCCYLQREMTIMPPHQSEITQMPSYYAYNGRSSSSSSSSNLHYLISGEDESSSTSPSQQQHQQQLAV